MSEFVPDSPFEIKHKSDYLALVILVAICFLLPLISLGILIEDPSISNIVTSLILISASILIFAGLFGTGMKSFNVKIKVDGGDLYFLSRKFLSRKWNLERKFNLSAIKFVEFKTKTQTVRMRMFRVFKSTSFFTVGLRNGEKVTFQAIGWSRKAAGRVLEKIGSAYPLIVVRNLSESLGLT